MRRYPLQALLDAAGMTLSALRDVCPMSGQTYRNARTLGLTEQQADRYACTVGLVPWLIWSDWLEDAEKVCADTSCQRAFVPERRNTIYCSPKCARRVASRRYQARRYATDGDYRQAKVERNRQYKIDARPARLVKQRLYYHQNAETLRAKRRERYAAGKAA